MIGLWLLSAFKDEWITRVFQNFVHKRIKFENKICKILNKYVTII